MIDYSLSRALKVIILTFQFGFVGYGSAQRVQDGWLAYYFVSNMLQSFNLSGQIEPNPGLDGSDIEEFLSILEKYDQLFKQDFSAGSAYCRRFSDSPELAVTDSFDVLFGDGAWRKEVSRFGENFWTELGEKFGSRLMSGAVDRAFELAKHPEIATEYRVALPTIDFTVKERIGFSKQHCQLKN